MRAIFGPTGDEDQTIGLVRTAVTASDYESDYGLAKETGWCVQRGRCHAVNLKADKAAPSGGDEWQPGECQSLQPVPRMSARGAWDVQRGTCSVGRSQVVESVTNDDRMWKLGEGGEDKVVTMLYLPN